MKLFSLLLIVALCAISSVMGGCANEKRNISNSDASNHVLCIQFKKSNCLHCRANGNYLRCDTKPAVTSNPASKKGPAPSGHYAIGSLYRHSKHHISWANLYPRKRGNRKGWWDYYRKNPDVPGQRSHIGLHPGTISWGCITVTDSSCWSQLEKMLKSKRGDTITVSKRWWRTATIRRKGTIRVMD